MGFAGTDRNGHWDLAAMDITGDNVIDAYQLDPNANGVLGDEIRYDLNQDNDPDFVTYDHNEDRIADAYAAENTGRQAVAPANPAYVTTVMPMQGAYWSSVQGESLQMTFTRLLQTETNSFTQVQLANAIALGNLRGW